MADPPGEPMTAAGTGHTVVGVLRGGSLAVHSVVLETTGMLVFACGIALAVWAVQPRNGATGPSGEAMRPATTCSAASATSAAGNRLNPSAVIVVTTGKMRR
jgi:hypothetical protein